MDEDYQLALLLQKELNDDLPEIKLDQPKKGKEIKSTHSLIDPQWEFIDPTPDIHVLFLQFNDRFFWGKLHGVEVKWSPRMTSCAGVCVYQGKSGFCSVRLSLPLLKLRPRKDLVETLLHEMIHAFLFVTKNNRDRDGHGPEFHRHMDRINGEAGTHISVYHTFHDEVRLYQQHWWRCDGPCQHRPPFFGMVRRSMNRAPGPYDNWWAQHQATCGGKFVKVKEPDDTKKKASNTKQKTSGDTKGKIYSFFPVSANSGSSVKKVANISDSNADNSKSFTNPSSSGSSTKNSEDYQLDSNRIGASSIFRKPAMSNVHGLGSDKHSASLVKPTVNPAINNVFGFGDLSGQKNTKPNGSHPPSGKGNVLGGSRKPPFAVGKGGVLANKGSGTIVVSGTKNKNQGLPGSSTIWNHNTKTQVFSGTGHVLGKGTSRPSAASSSVQVKSPEKLNPFPLIVPMCTNKDEDISRKRKSFENVSNEEVTSSAGLSRVICPVCSEQVLGSVINSHLDHCIVSFKKPTETKLPKLHTSSDDVIVLSDSEDTIPSAGDKVPEFEADVYCPSCNNKLKKSNLDSHLSLCVGNSFEDDDSIEIVSENPGKNAKCPICGNDVCTGEMDKHLENCASCSIQDLSGVFDEDFSDEEEDAAVGSPSKRISESGEPLFPCPCCLVLIESIKMHDHLDQCVA